MNASDDVVLLREWPVANGDRVEKGCTIAVCESSKAAFEVTATGDGYLHFQLPIDQEVAVGGLLAVISSEPEYQWSTAVQDNPEQATSDQRFSKAAQQLVDAHQIPASAFAGMDLVGQRDVQAYLDRQSPPPLCGTRILVCGGRGHGRVCLDILRARAEYEIAGIVDDDLEVGIEVLGFPVLGTFADLPRLYDSGITKAIMAIACLGNLRSRENLCERVRRIGFEIPNLIHPKAIIEPSVRMGTGVQVLAGAIVGSLAKLHDDCVINHGSIVSHDCVIHQNAHLAPGCILAGNVEVGSNTLMGMGATVYLGTRIGQDVVVHNGYNVVHDVPDATVLGR